MTQSIVADGEKVNKILIIAVKNVKLFRLCHDVLQVSNNQVDH